jgi:hypothetical protein
VLINELKYAGQDLYGICDDAGWDGILSDLATAQRNGPEEEEGPGS